MTCSSLTDPPSVRKESALKKRIPLLLALCLLLTVPALAAEDSMENFVRSKTYTGQFSDLSADSVFFRNVSALYEYGLSVGKPDGTYGLKDPLTVGQAVIFAGRIRSLYRTGDPEQGPAAYRTDGQAAAEAYLRYLQAEDILGTELDKQLTQLATRAQMAHVLANLLPQESLPSINDELVTEGYATRRFITDVTEYTPYYQDILSLYRSGVCAGVDEHGAFLPDRYPTNITTRTTSSSPVMPNLLLSKASPPYAIQWMPCQLCFGPMEMASSIRPCIWSSGIYGSSQNRLSSEPVRLSPIRKICPSGTSKVVSSLRVIPLTGR